MAATKIAIETRADGAGTLISAQSLVPAQTLTVYAISRDVNDVFVANVAATWTLTSKTGSVVDGDLVAAGDTKSAVFTADENGTAIIHAATADPFTADTGIVSIIDALLSLATLKQYLGVTGSGSDALLADWLITITGVLESELNQPIVSRPVTDILNGSGAAVQYLRSGRIISLVGSDETARLSNLQSRATAISAWADIMTEETQISIDEENAMKIELLDGFVFPLGRKNIRVYFNCGLSGRALLEIQKIALEKIQTMWDESKQGGNLLGKVSRNLGEGGMSQNLSLKDMDSRWAVTINRYRRLGYE